MGSGSASQPPLLVVSGECRLALNRLLIRGELALHYRPDVDGMRAIAIMSVVLSHAGVHFLAGGFLGVDMFFVISGYLITVILQKNMDLGLGYIPEFYEKRARRIMPALILVISCSIPFSIWLMLPDFLQNFGQSVVATLLFTNNLLLAKTSGYWELESSFKPLIHTWSLGVEEQFYLLFPIILTAIGQFSKNRQLIMISLLGLISLLLAEHGWRSYPDVSFYLPTSRAWELMVGCATAYIDRTPRRTDNAMSFIALLMLLGPMFLFNEQTPSPSFYSAVPVFGASGIILFSRPGTIAYRLLSLRPLVFIGLISYSAYLWHQPLFAFARVASLNPPEPWMMAGLTLLTFVLATLSWRYVEQPFRDRSWIPLRTFVPIIGTMTTGLIIFGLVVHFSQGFPRHIFPNLKQDQDVYIGYNESIRKLSTDSFPNNDKRNILLLGNSFARDFGNILRESGLLKTHNFVYIERQPITPSVNISSRERQLYRKASVIIVVLEKPSPDDIVGQTQQISRFIAQWTDAPVVFAGSKSFGYNINPFGRVPLNARSESFAQVPDVEERANNILVRSLSPGNYLDVIRLLGPNGRSLHFFDADGNPLTPDRKHLTRYGAMFIAAQLASQQPTAWKVIAGVGEQ